MCIGLVAQHEQEEVETLFYSYVPMKSNSFEHWNRNESGKFFENAREEDFRI